MKKILLLLLVIVSIQNAGAQKQGNIWYFGNKAGLDFNGGAPLPLGSGAMLASEGCSSVADRATGQLLFYTNGIAVWDRNHQQMPACIGTPLNGHQSSSHSAVIVPQPGSNTRYYIFTTPAFGGESGQLPAMCYSMVDMNLNGGNGDLVSINNPLIDTSTEKIAVTGNCDGSVYWVVGHKMYCDSFYAYRLTAAGLEAPVKSRAGAVHGSYEADSSGSIAAGCMKFSSDGKRLGLTITTANIGELFDFDFNTGLLSNPVTDHYAPATASPYGCSFSPDNSKFYVGCMPPGTILYQYNLNAGNAAAVLATRVSIAQREEPVQVGALQNGPDGRMYMATVKRGILHVIEHPNAGGAACGFIYAGQPIGDPPVAAIYSLPSIIESSFYYSRQFFKVPERKALCKGEPIQAYQDQANTFEITPAAGVSISSDRMIVTFSPDTTTTYTVISHGDCATDTTVFTIMVKPRPVAGFLFLPADPAPGDAFLTLSNQSEQAQQYSWYDADGRLLSSATDLVMPHPGLGTFCFRLVAADTVGCTDTATNCIAITRYGPAHIPNAFSPNADGLNDVFRIYGVYGQLEEFSVFNRYGERVFYSRDRSLGWDGRYKGAPCDPGSYGYYIRYVAPDGRKETRKGTVTLVR